MNRSQGMVANFTERYAAEQSTGCRQHSSSLGKYYARGGKEIPPHAALAAIVFENYPVEVPNAGAGSYREFFTSLGFAEVQVYEDSSSAGDWSFAVKVKDGVWHPAFQENRYPYRGFKYSVDFKRTFASFEQFCAHAND